MAFRKIKAKRYNGILEYFNPKSTDKETRAFYLSYRDEFGKTRKVKLESLNKDEALKEANIVRDGVRIKSKDIKADSEAFERAVRMKDLTLLELSKEYFDKRNAKNNHRDERVFDNRVPESLKKIKVKRIVKSDILSVVEELKKKEYAPKTINITIDLLSGIFSWGIKQDLTNNQPISRDKGMIKTYIPKEEVSTETGRVLTEKEMDRLWEALEDNKRLDLFIRLCYYTGARPDAILTLKVADINFDKGEVRIKAMKGARDYMQLLRAEALDSLRGWVESEELNNDEMFIFYPNKKGTSIDKYKHTTYDSIGNSARAVFDKLFNVGKDTPRSLRRVTLYSLRRTSATVVYRAKGLAVASKFLHHSDVRTTMKYLGIDEDIQGAIDAL